MPSVGVVFGEIGHMVPEAFKQDRAKMSGSTFSTEAMAAAAPFAKDQWRAHADFVAETSGRRTRLYGRGETRRRGHPRLYELLVDQGGAAASRRRDAEEFPKIEAWVARVAALGHGKPTPMDSKEALAIAKAATSDAKPQPTTVDPRGLKSGDKVTVSADDYGRDPIAGEIVFSNAHEIAIRRNAPAGEVVVHFPRAGFTVVPAKH